MLLFTTNLTKIVKCNARCIQYSTVQKRKQVQIVARRTNESIKCREYRQITRAVNIERKKLPSAFSIANYDNYNEKK